MSPEIGYLLLSTGLLILIHLVEVTHNLIAMGLVDALSGLENLDKPAWRQRLAFTEINLTHNLVIFAVLVLVAHVQSVSNDATVLGAAIFFFSRVGHALVYTFRIPFLRAIFYVAGLGGCVLIAVQLL